MPKVGTHARDRRFVDARGQEWASKLESQIYEALRTDERLSVRKCSTRDGDTFSYSTPIRKGYCLDCGSGEIAKGRTYTPDLYILPKGKTGHKRRGFYVEIKAYWPPSKRNLFRYFLKAEGAPDTRIILEESSAYRLATGKLNLLEYVHKYMKVPVHVWNGRLPDNWYEG